MSLLVDADALLKKWVMGDPLEDEEWECLRASLKAGHYPHICGPNVEPVRTIFDVLPGGLPPGEDA